MTKYKVRKKIAKAISYSPVKRARKILNILLFIILVIKMIQQKIMQYISLKAIQEKLALISLLIEMEKFTNQFH